LDWIFKERLQLDYAVTHDQSEWLSYSGPKINYSDKDLAEGALCIKPVTLLFEKKIQAQQLGVQRWKRTTVLFYNQPGKKIPFDLFSAVFFLMSRYEEYLPHKKDQHDRFSVEQSVAATFGFLDEPIIDSWIFQFRIILSETFNLFIPTSKFEILQTFDIDMAWKYLYKGKKRIYGAYLKDFLKGDFGQITERKAVLNHKIADPFYSFATLNDLHQQCKTKALFFILLGTWSAFDKNTNPQHPAMLQLMKELAAQYECGIHPSYKSHEDIEVLNTEIQVLSSAIEKPVLKSRQHFIKFTLPESYQKLIKLGIEHDYSMGYASRNGFRASTSHSFLWYDLSQEKTTDLRVHPFAFMDATSKFYLKQSQEQTFQEWLHLYHKIKQVNGVFISIWHNYILSNKQDKASWMGVYEKVLKVV